jgi:ferredoxin--NADP+ reductase
MAELIPGTVIAKMLWTPRLVSLQFAADLLPFKAGQFLRVAIDINGERVGKPYSFINAPEGRPHEIYFNIIDQGVLSTHLSKLEPGDPIWVSKTAHGFLTLDEVPEATHLWLLATGTAIGPFLSILNTAEPWRRFKKIVLAHGVREARDLGYQSIINELTDRYGAQFCFIPLLSREQTGTTLHGRIPAHLINGSLEQQAGIEINTRDSHVMLCGNSGMINDTIELLGKRGLQRHRRREPGQISSENYF